MSRLTYKYRKNVGRTANEGTRKTKAAEQETGATDLVDTKTPTHFH